MGFGEGGGLYRRVRRRHSKGYGALFTATEYLCEAKGSENIQDLRHWFEAEKAQGCGHHFGNPLLENIISHFRMKEARSPQFDLGSGEQQILTAGMIHQSPDLSLSSFVAKGLLS